jgi:AraC-like DNA-binding protein
MKYKTFSLILIVQAVLMTLMMCSCAPSPKEGPVAVRGVVDLTKWDFRKDGPVLLDRGWEFYWMRLLSPGDLSKINTAGGGRYMGLGGMNLFFPWWELYNPDFYNGFATYRMKIISESGRAGNLGLLIHTAQSSHYKLYINGVLVHRNGRPVTGMESIQTGYVSSVLPLSSPDGVYDLVIQADNYRYTFGSTDYDIMLGSLSSLQEHQQKKNLLSVIVLIAIVIFGLHQLLLFALDPSERQYLYFAMTCLFTITYSLGIHYNYWSTILPVFPFENVHMIMIGLLYVGDIFFIAYFQYLFPLDMSKSFLYIYAAVTGILGLFLVVLPQNSFAYLLGAYHIHAAVSTLFLIFFIARAIVFRREDAMIVLAGALGTMAFGITIFICNTQHVTTGTLDFISINMALFGLVQTVATSRNFIRAHRRSMNVAADNERLRAIIGERMRAGSHAMTDGIEERIESAIGYLRENFKEDISRENLAASLNLHPDNFSRYFKMHTGKKYTDYLMDLRIAEATRLLRETDTPITTIAMDVGFRSLRTFNHVFMNATGRKPSDFRNGK